MPEESNPKDSHFIVLCEKLADGTFVPLTKEREWLMCQGKLPMNIWEVREIMRRF